MEDRKTIFGTFAASVLLAPTLALAQAAYDYQVIDYPGAAETQVFGINEHGIAVGNGISLEVYPFVYDINKGTFTDAANVASYEITAFLGISNSGRLVGSVELSGTTSGLIRSLQGSDSVFDHPGAVAFTQARGTNSQGLVSGYRDSEDPNVLYGFVYDPASGSFTDIAPSFLTITHGMNARGDVVGSALYIDGLGPEDPCPDLVVDGLVREYGWLRAADGALTYFTVNGRRTSARGINERGQIAGSSIDISGGTFLEKGFVITLEGQACEALTVAVEDLLEFPGYDLTIPEGITNSGNVVGVVTGIGDVFHGFIARPR